MPWPSKNVADYRGRFPSWIARQPLPFAVIGVIAGLLWFVAFFVIVTGEWYLECNLDGSRLAGIDCLQALPGSARSDVAPARWLGFSALLWTLVGATLVVAVCAVVAGRQDRADRP